MIEKRKCNRFKVPGATLICRTEKLVLSDREYSEEIYPLADLSKGGLSFFSKRRFKKNTRLAMKVFLPGEEIPITIRGRVSWKFLSSEMEHRYQTGVQFDPYGKGKHLNNPRFLEKIKDLEKEYSNKEEPVNWKLSR